MRYGLISGRDGPHSVEWIIGSFRYGTGSGPLLAARLDEVFVAKQEEMIGKAFFSSNRPEADKGVKQNPDNVARQMAEVL